MIIAPESAGPYQKDLQMAARYIHRSHKIPCGYSGTSHECLKKLGYNESFDHAIPPALSTLRSDVEAVSIS
jgi:hypothetical protein